MFNDPKLHFYLVLLSWFKVPFGLEHTSLKLRQTVLMRPIKWDIGQDSEHTKTYVTKLLQRIVCIF